MDGGMHQASIEKVCHDKHYGDLGIIDTKVWNRGALQGMRQAVQLNVEKLAVACDSSLAVHTMMG